ncbi:44224_t:CDS:1, partial [Gigaspora margarita]
KKKAILIGTTQQHNVAPKSSSKRAKAKYQKEEAVAKSST